MCHICVNSSYAEAARSNAAENVHYGTYQRYYSSDGWVCRKIAALPAALFSALIKSIYHLAYVIFLGLPTLFTGESEPLKTHIYNIGRDLEEALGWIVVLFHDQAGSYLIEEALFFKEQSPLPKNRPFLKPEIPKAQISPPLTPQQINQLLPDFLHPDKCDLLDSLDPCVFCELDFSQCSQLDNFFIRRLFLSSDPDLIDIVKNRLSHFSPQQIEQIRDKVAPSIASLLPPAQIEGEGHNPRDELEGR